MLALVRSSRPLWRRGCVHASTSVQPPTGILRHFSLSSRWASARQAHIHALTGYAFAGKPRPTDAQADTDISSGKEEDDGPTPAARQGYPVDTPIGRWVDAMQRGAEAGEDALAVAPMRGEGDWLLAVADGVGGWSESGVDPALFSQTIMFHAAQYGQRFYACPERFEAEDLAFDSASTPPASPLATPPLSPASTVAASRAEPGTPLDVLQHAYQSTLAQAEVPAGSATACILTFDASKGILRSANLGDSGFLVLRPGSSTSSASASADGKGRGAADATEDGVNEADVGLHLVHHQSKPQTHGFNTPLQLSKLPPEFRFDGSIDSQPSNADTFACRLLDGDIVLVATDGFWDNVSKAEVLQLVAFVRSKHHAAWLSRATGATAKHDGLAEEHHGLAEERDLANVLAHNLLQYAIMCQFTTTKTSPFERDAARHGIHYPGGKVDDVAVIAALIVER